MGFKNKFKNQEMAANLSMGSWFYVKRSREEIFQPQTDFQCFMCSS